VIDETGASQWLVPEKPRRKKTIGVQGSRELPCAKMARIPPKKVSKDDAEVAQARSRPTSSGWSIGQDDAIEALSASIKLARAGLREPEQADWQLSVLRPDRRRQDRSRQAARQSCSAWRLLRFDMSEYMERHTVSRLIGAPPGYVGFDQGGLLTDGVDQHPHCVLLLDEIEKAHPDLFNMLLQVMDHGKLTDPTARKSISAM
jgi:ATP-dependent Clp protease ATP-binding subunit ClpA